MPTYTGYAVFKVTAINTANNTITATWLNGPLVIPANGSNVKATFIKSTDLQITANGSNSALPAGSEITFNYRTKF